MNNPEFIYKYRNWSNDHHKNCFINNKLYYASPFEINDPFDFKISIDYSLLNSEKKREQYVDYLIRTGFDKIIQNGIDPRIKKEELLWNLFSNNSKMQDDYDLVQEKWFNDRLGVISFSTVLDEILMWSHYADNHKGFCLGFNKSKFEASQQYGSAGYVKYEDKYPSLDPIQNEKLQTIISQSYIKSKKWEYEKEYRLTKLWSLKNPTKEEKLITYSTHFLEEITLGLNISVKQQKSIIANAKRKNIRIYKIKKVRHAFSLEREEL